MLLMVGAESTPLEMLSPEEVSLASEAVLDALLDLERDGEVDGPVAHFSLDGRTVGARFFVDAPTYSQAVERAVDVMLRALIRAVTVVKSAELPVGTRVGVAGVEAEGQVPVQALRPVA